MSQQDRTLLLGVFDDVEQVARAAASLEEAKVTPGHYQVIGGKLYPEAVFNEMPSRRGLYVYPLAGVGVGLAIGLLFTAWSLLSVPSTAEEQPTLSFLPTAFIIYEAAILGAIVFTAFGIVLESRLGWALRRQRNSSLPAGHLGLLVSCEVGWAKVAETLLRDAGAIEVKRGVSPPGDKGGERR